MVGVSAVLRFIVRLVQPGNLTSRNGRPESTRNTASRTRSATARLIRSLWKEERSSYREMTRMVTVLARIPARQTLVTRTPWHREREVRRVLVMSWSYLDIIGKVYEVVGVFKL